MRFSEIKNALKHLIKTTTCLHCQGVYQLDDINVIATTKVEGLFEMQCNNCHASSIMTVVLTPETEKMETKKKNIYEAEFRPGQISPNDILDLKLFLNKFDGDFKKLFPNEK